MRAALLARDLTELERLARSAPVEEMPAATQATLGGQIAAYRRNANADAHVPEVAIALLRRAQQRFPADFWINHGLGEALWHTKPRQLDAAIGFLRVAVALRPQSPGARLNLGAALQEAGDLDAAIAEYRESIRLKQDYAEAHGNLGLVLRAKGDLDGAIAEDREAIRLKQDYAEAYCNLGLMLRDKGRFAEALACMRRGHELGSRRPGWRTPSAQWVSECEQLVEVDARLVRVLKGEVQPADAGDRVCLAYICQLKSLHAPAVRLYAAAFAEQPKLAADPRLPHRYNAACAAIAAAQTGTADAAKELATQADKPALRRRARDWLQADIDNYAEQLKTGKLIFFMEKQLAHWQTDPDLKNVREEQVLAKLPDAERAEWRKLWADVDQLLKQARSLVTVSTIPGALTNQQREQVHELKLQAGTTYIIDMKSTALDSFLKLYDAAGKLLAENDDIAPNNLDARIEFTPKKPGVYRITATSFEQRGRGAYTLTIRAVGK